MSQDSLGDCRPGNSHFHLLIWPQEDNLEEEEAGTRDKAQEDSDIEDLALEEASEATMAITKEDQMPRITRKI